MPSFALNLDLSLYFEDLRKFASVYVDSSKCKEVGDVENHIKSIFKLDDDICFINNKKFLIPRCESIHILQQYEILKVQKCDFYDYQIHKHKKSSPSCDHPALNLIQSDRTIDLSCRPKQRLKINICQNHCIVESPLASFESDRFRNATSASKPQVVLRENASNEISEIQSKHKTKSKKKKYDLQKDEEEIDSDETSINILDMSVNKMKKKIKDDISLDEEKQHMIVDVSSYCKTQPESNHNTAIESKRKSKKRKKIVEAEEIDLANSFWENIETDNGSEKKGKSKIKNGNEFNDGIAKDFSLTVNNKFEVNSIESNLKHCHSEQDSVKKKQKKNSSLDKKKQEAVFDGASPSITQLQFNEEIPKEYIKKSKKRNKHSEVEENDLTTLSWKNLETDKGSEKQRKNKTNHFDKECNDSMAEDFSLTVNGNILKTNNTESNLNSYVFEDNSAVNRENELSLNSDVFNKPSSQFVTLNTSDITPNVICVSTHCEGFDSKVNGERNIDEVDIEPSCPIYMENDQSIALNSSKMTNIAEDNDLSHRTVNGSLSHNEDKISESFQSSTNIKRRKRIRKHNKKSKKERQQIMSTVGGFLNEVLRKQPKIASPSSSEVAKHIYFTEEDFIDEMQIPKTPPNIPQSNLKDDSAVEDMPQDDPPETLDDWKEQLQKLTFCKPMVFSRNQPKVVTDTNNSPAKSSESAHVSSPNKEKCLINPIEDDIKQLAVNCIPDGSTSNGVLCSSSNAEVESKSELITSSSKFDFKGSKPDLKNVNVSDYPIVDKVATGDFVLFKVLKLSENLEPICSGSILARVENASNFPNTISLQIIEGLEECANGIITVQNGENYFLQLQWSEMVEPRLFYP